MDGNDPGAPLLRVDSERGPGGVRGFRWLLVARNGRVLARGHALFGDRSSAQADFAALTTHPERLAMTVEHAAARGGWRWRVGDTEGRTVLVSPRSYERYGTCQRAGRRILAALAQSGQTGPSGQRDGQPQDGT